MWPFFWRSRNRFSLDELKYLNDQLWEIQTVNDTNEDFVIETLRSIAELITYGDQHDSSFFDFFMERQIMAQFIRILKISKTMSVAIQLLQTLSIMIQNLRTEHAIYYLFSNEHVNNLITYRFDFHNEELLNYYISFLRAISGKLDKNTISLLVKTQNDEVVSFPLYSESIKFVNHEENMIHIYKALMGSKSEEEQLFASSLGGVKDEIYNEPELYIQNLKSHYHLPILTCEQGGSPGMHRYQVFVLHCQLRSSVLGGNMHENPQLGNLKNSTENSRVRRAGLDIATPKIGSELTLAADDALLCRIAFERGKERHFYFLAVSKGTSGCMLLAEEMPLKPHCGVVRITAPLAGSNPRIDEKHPRWLHVRIRPLNLPFMESAKGGCGTGRSRTKGLVDGRWTLAFANEEACMCAKSTILEEMALQSSAVEKELEPLLNYDVVTNSQGRVPSGFEAAEKDEL